MAKSRTKRGRLKQVEGWLRVECPQPRPTRVLYKAWDDDHEGWTDRKGRTMILYIHPKCTLSASIRALFEEWAHARAWPLARIENFVREHSPEFGLAYADILHKYFDLEGEKDSWRYPEK